MYLPTYTITNLILSYIVRYELAILRITLTPLPATHFKALYEKLHAEDTDQLGQLIGYQIGYSKALSVQRGKVFPSARSDMKIFINYRSAQDFIDFYRSSEFIKPSAELAVHINKLLLKGLVDDWELGKFREFSDKPNEIYDTWYKHREFYPSIRFNRYFDEVFQWIEKPQAKVHKLIQLACLMHEFLDKSPFLAGNQITSILTLAAVAKEYGYNPDNIIPFTKALNFINSDLLAAYKMTKKKRDLTVFIEAFLYTLSLTAQNVENQYIDLFNNKVKKHSKLQTMFNPRQIKVLDYLEVEGKISRNAYAKMMGTSFMTAFRDLQVLLKEGYIVQKGVGRGTFYVLKKRKEEEEEKKQVFA
jgi:Fic family protein